MSRWRQSQDFCAIYKPNQIGCLADIKQIISDSSITMALVESIIFARPQHLVQSRPRLQTTSIQAAGMEVYPVGSWK